MMKILKASAGSGKTYRLSHRYLDILLNSPEQDAYRHILAVTFTNKATAEMKSRILRDLHEEARTNPKAGKVLTAILHDYSSFAVSTIDRFFQQALKAFSRELGQFADYQIELDRDSLIQESVDRMLDSLTEDQKDLIDWIRTSVDEKLAGGERFDIDSGPGQIGRQLKSEEFRTMSRELGFDPAEAYSKASLSELRKQCKSTIEECSGQIAALGGEVTPGKRIEPLKKTKRARNPELGDYLDKNIKRYNTACLVSELIYSLGLAGEFQREFDALLKEKNVMCLEESNALLKDIIDGSDAPFVYEKLGVRFNDFLLDEFQDTSIVQWDNFRPLLAESEARGGSNLVVGDIKQSIYRWRNSDWTLLGSEVQKCFPDAEVESLQQNWRSARNIVNFNNSFFRYAAGRLGLESLYSDVWQEVASKETQGGNVKVSFTDEQLDEVCESVMRARNAGAGWGDIAVLVRNHSQGSSVASELIARKIPVISDDSLNLKSSTVVRRLVSLLHGIDNPADKVNSYLAQSLGLEYPDSYHSVIDLCELLLRSLRDFDPAVFEGESVYVQAFMDDIQAWTEVNGNNLRYYLKHWEEKPKFIGTPENSQSVRILTIHKSKGLEIPYVIFPYADKVTLYSKDTRWCEFDGRLYPVELTKGSADTEFEKDYARERRMQTVDNVNLFYVALTRAQKCLHVIARRPSAACRAAVAAGKEYEWTSMSELLYAFSNGMDGTESGDMYDFGRMEREVKDNGTALNTVYCSYPLGPRLVPSTDASDFFGSDGVVGAGASPRLNGIWLHGILEHTDRLSDLRPAIDATLSDGQYTEAEAESAFSLLSTRISAHPEWFGDQPGRAYRNETSIIGADGREYRPDRVVVNPDSSVTVIDYKFGEKRESYLRQLRGYMNLYRKLGYSDVRGFIWYVREDEVEEV